MIGVHRAERTQRDIKKTMPCNVKGRVWIYAAKKQCTPRIAKRYRPEKLQRTFSQTFSANNAQHCQNPDFRTVASRTELINCFC